MPISGKQEHVRSYGRCAAGDSVVYRPTDEDQVKEVFDVARKNRQRVVIRGGGHSFDGQAVHDRDTGRQIILNTDCFLSDKISFAPDGKRDLLRLGAGVKWGDFIKRAIQHAVDHDEPIRIPGSLQTGRKATVGGTLAGDCLSRFSGTAGKESQWIDSFRLLTTSGEYLTVTENEYPDLFNAVIGGHGYIGLVTDATYKLIEIDKLSCALTTISLHDSFRSLIDTQLWLIGRHGKGTVPPSAVSSAWFTGLLADPKKIKGAVFDSSYGNPSDPPLPGFPLYGGIESNMRYWIELLARLELPNLIIHEYLFNLVKKTSGRFQNDLQDFLFFMDGNTVAKERFEALHPPKQFPIVQQTFVVPPESAEAFAEHCMAKMRSHSVRPAECDMLFARQDDCFMSGNYKLDGFAVSFGFEPIAPKGCAPDKISKLLKELSKDCSSIGGRIHLVKNVSVDPDVFQCMFSPQMKHFEEIKRQYDPELLLQNPFSDTFFRFRRSVGSESD